MSEITHVWWEEAAPIPDDALVVLYNGQRVRGVVFDLGDSPKIDESEGEKDKAA